MMRIGIITAMAEETLPIYQKLGNLVDSGEVAGVEVHKFVVDDDEVFLAKSGVGELRAALTAQVLVDIFEVEAVLNFGFVGSLTNRLNVGDLVLVGAVVHYQFDTSAFDGYPAGQYENHDLFFKASAGLIGRVQTELGQPLPVVIVASGDKFVASKEEKERLSSTFGAYICEMECAGIAMACERNKIPFVSMKVVSDSADENANLSFAEVSRKGLTKYEHVLPIVLKVVAGKSNTPLPPVKY